MQSHFTPGSLSYQSVSFHLVQDLPGIPAETQGKKKATLIAYVMGVAFFNLLDLTAYELAYAVPEPACSCNELRRKHPTMRSWTAMLIVLQASRAAH